MSFKWAIIFTAIFAGQITLASTFVGNGGNAHDIELQVTIKQTRKVFEEIRDQVWEIGSLCKCAEELQGHPQCRILDPLSPAQQAACRTSLAKYATDFIELLQPQSKLQILWTAEQIEVQESQTKRPVHAVARSQQKTIYLNYRQFVDLKPYERVFLLTHELGHLIPIQGQMINDEQSFESFKQQDGGRQFLNSLGAAVSTMSILSDSAGRDRNTLERSQSHRSHWLMLSFGGDAGHNDESAFAIKKYTSGSLQYRYQFNPQIGASIASRFLRGEETFMQIAKATNE